MKNTFLLNLPDSLRYVLRPSWVPEVSEGIEEQIADLVCKNWVLPNSSYSKRIRKQIVAPAAAVYSVQLLRANVRSCFSSDKHLLSVLSAIKNSLHQVCIRDRKTYAVSIAPPLSWDHQRLS